MPRGDSADGSRTVPASGRSSYASPSGMDSIRLAALTIGLTIVGIQLWMLTVALDLYLGGRGSTVWQLAVASGALFSGGVLMDRLLNVTSHSRVRGRTGSGTCSGAYRGTYSGTYSGL